MRYLEEEEEGKSRRGDGDLHDLMRLKKNWGNTSKWDSVWDKREHVLYVRRCQMYVPTTNTDSFVILLLVLCSHEKLPLTLQHCWPDVTLSFHRTSVAANKPLYQLPHTFKLSVKFL